MVVCPRCHEANPPDHRFCGQCGTALEAAGCPSCGSPIAAEQRFCGQCGAGVNGVPTPAPVLEERKLATVLFADVVGFTSLAERTDPEIVARIVDGAFRELGRIVAEHGGTVDKYMGDSVMAVFGVPVAHDDDAERAVAAALAMRQLGGDLVFSIGVNSGEVMATVMGGEGEVTVIGDTVNVAARLEKAAGPGEVLCGQLTAELAGARVRFRARQAVLAKGKREPVEVWEAVALCAPHDDASMSGPALVGRQDELAFLEAQWRRVSRERQAQVVVVCGDAGAGKTRLVSELAQMCAAEGTVVRSTYPAYGALGGARVAAEVIRQLGPVSDPDVDVRVRSIAGELDDSLRAIDPAAMHQEQLWALGRLLQEKGGDRPILIAIDDVHRSGEQMLRLLGELSGRLTNVPLLTVLSGRTEPGSWLTWFPAATTVRLGPLSRSDALDLVRGFSSERPLRPEAADFIVERAAGNPLYVRELVSVGRAQGLLVEEAGHYRLADAGPIPATLQALLAARLDALEPTQKRAVQLTAVMGGATLEHLDALGASESEPALRALVEVGLLRQTAERRFEAVDSLLREVAYETLPRNVRGDLHRSAARIVGPDERARHLERAAHYLDDDSTVAAEAAEALVTTAQGYLAASRQLDAIRLLEQAVALGWRDPATVTELGRIQALCGRHDDALATLALVEDDPDDPVVALERDHAVANVAVFTHPATSLPLLQDVTERWRARGDVAKEAWGHANTGVALFYLTRVEEAGQELERGFELFETIDDRFGAAAASSFLCLARPEDPRVPGWLGDALAFAEETGDRTRKLNTLTALTWHHTLRSLWGTAEEHAVSEGFARTLAQLAEELGAPELLVHGWSLLAVMARFSGRMDEAAACAARLEEVNDHPGSVPWLAWAARFAVTTAAGTRGATPPFPTGATADPVTEMAAYVIEAELTVAGRIEEALHRFQGDRANLGTISDLARMVRALALVLGGRPAEAFEHARRAADAARAMDAAPTARAVAGLLAEITGDTAALPPAPDPARSLADALVLRAYAAHGDGDAHVSLRGAARDLAMPGLLLGL